MVGCIERRIDITTEPPGALVYINDRALGRSPVSTEFLFHGVYDVRVEKDGFEPLRTTANAKAPLYENPPFDLVATALPFTFENVQEWHFVLEPRLEDQLSEAELEAQLLERADAMRDELRAIEQPEPPSRPAP
ncbi:MAG: PEGA domain-containing protein [Planctomycetota bacterium]